MKLNMLYRSWKAVNAMTLQGSFVKFSKVQDIVCFCPFLDWLIQLQGQKCSVSIGVKVVSKHSKRKKGSFKTMKTCIDYRGIFIVPILSALFLTNFSKTGLLINILKQNMSNFRDGVQIKRERMYSSRQFIFTERTYWSLKVYGWAVVAYIFLTLRNV